MKKLPYYCNYSVKEYAAHKLNRQSMAWESSSSFNHVKVKDLDYYHIENIINKLTRSGRCHTPWGETWVKTLKIELEYRSYMLKIDEVIFENSKSGYYQVKNDCYQLEKKNSILAEDVRTLTYKLNAISRENEKLVKENKNLKNELDKIFSMVKKSSRINFR